MADFWLEEFGHTDEELCLVSVRPVLASTRRAFRHDWLQRRSIDADEADEAETAADTFTLLSASSV